jgi:hypothetical protein
VGHRDHAEGAGRPPPLAAVRLRRRRGREPTVTVGDPRLEDWETVAEFEDTETALAWRDRLRELGVEAALTADQPLDRAGRGDIYLVVPPEQWSQANEVVENLD